MTVKELITMLLEEDMNTEVKLSINGDFLDEQGEKISGYLFDIDNVEHWGGLCCINFTDYRK